MTTKFNIGALQDYANLALIDNPLMTEKNITLLLKWKEQISYCANDRDKTISATMLENIDNFNATQEKSNPESKIQLELQRNEARAILINGFVNHFPLKDVIGIQPSSTPCTLVFYVAKKDGDTSLESISVTMKTEKFDNMYVFNYIEEHISKHLFKDVPVSGSISVFNFVEDFNTECSNIDKISDFNYIIVPTMKMSEDSFNVTGIGGIVKQFVDKKYKVIESSYVEDDEFYLIRKTKNVLAPVIFVPYIVPFPISPRVLDSVNMKTTICNLGRYAIVEHPQKNDFIKKFKLTY